MKKNKVKRILALMLCSAMLISLTACGENDDTSDKKDAMEDVKEDESKEDASDDEQKKELITLTSYGQDAIGDINNAGWYAELLAEEVGIILDAKPNTGGTDLMSAYLASGELPDIIVFNSKDNLYTAVQGGMLVELEQYKDKLPNIFEVPMMEKAIHAAKVMQGADGLYGVPGNVGDNTMVISNPQVRWDVYEDIGKPEIETWYDFLDVLKEMQEAYPKNEEGLDVYGMGFFTDWDGDRCYPVWTTYMFLNGWQIEASPLAYVSADATGDVTSILSDDGEYLKGLKWLNTAVNMGIVDPESNAQVFDNYNGKAANGQYLFTWWDWYRGYSDEYSEDYYGYAPVWPDDMRMKLGTANILGEGRWIGISSACENVDAALEFLNWFYAEETCDLLINGPEGLLYEWSEDGTRVPTELAIELSDNGEQYTFEAGGTLEDARNVLQILPYTSSASHSSGDGYLEAAWNGTYKKALIANKDKNYLLESWEAEYGVCDDVAPNMFNIAEKNGRKIPITSAVLSLIEPAEQDIQTITNQIAQIVVQNSWKMMYAEDEAEFEAIWEETKADAEALGINQVIEDAKVRFQAAKDLAASYGIEVEE